MLSYLSEYAYLFGPLRLLRSIPVRTMGAATTALIIGFIIGPWMIRRFRELKFGHGYIDERTGSLGATYFDKKHTPTMGGLIIFLSVFVSSVLWAEPNVLITAHSAGQTPHSFERYRALLLDNMRRYDRGEALVNVVDKRLGY